MDENWSDWKGSGKPGGTDRFVALAVGQNTAILILKNFRVEPLVTRTGSSTSNRG